MSESVLIWLFAGSYGLGFIAVTLVGKHVLSCNRMQMDAVKALARIEERLENVIVEIGTHDTGIIGQLHRYSKEIAILNERLKK